MLSIGGEKNAAELLLDEKTEVIDYFLKALSGACTANLSWATIDRALTMTTKFEMASTGRHLLEGVQISTITSTDLFKIFAYASATNDVFLGGRVLLRGYAPEESVETYGFYSGHGGTSLHPYSSGGGRGQWTTQHISKLNPCWVWALQKGVHNQMLSDEEDRTNRSKPEYWEELVGRFFVNLGNCKHTSPATPVGRVLSCLRSIIMM